MLQPRLAAIAGYIALAITLCVAQDSHMPHAAYVVAFAVGFAVARFGPSALEHLRGRAFANPALSFGVFASACAVGQLEYVALSGHTSRSEVETIAHVTVTLLFAYLWEILYDLGGPKKRPSTRAAGDAVRRLVDRVASVHGAPSPVAVPTQAA
ncbi:MAG: hypothetical protein NVS2B8_09150 [Vulcanimicrobiaceae bacterium]